MSTHVDAVLTGVPAGRICRPQRATHGCEGAVIYDGTLLLMGRCREDTPSGRPMEAIGLGSDPRREPPAWDRFVPGDHMTVTPSGSGTGKDSAGCSGLPPEMPGTVGLRPVDDGLARLETGEPHDAAAATAATVEVPVVGEAGAA